MRSPIAASRSRACRSCPTACGRRWRARRADESATALRRRRHRRAAARRGFVFPHRSPRIEWFGDSPQLARELGELVRRGIKRASAGLLAAWHADGDPLPRVGDVEIVVDWSGEPLAVVEVTEVRVLPFDEVDAAFARDEGEDDGSLAAWRDAHWRYLSRECARVGREPAATMAVVCRRFRLLHAC